LASLGYLEGVCASVLPAADLEAADVRPSRIVLDAAVAASGDVWRFESPVWESALAEDSLVFFPVVFLFLLIGQSPDS
jgi:hypothetical protein